MHREGADFSQPQMFIAETGWPSKSSDASNANNGFADASVENLQKFMDNFICQSNTNGTGYFYFEVSWYKRVLLLTVSNFNAHSTLMSRGRTRSLAVLKAGGVYSTPSMSCSPMSSHPRLILSQSNPQSRYYSRLSHIMSLFGLCFL